MNRKGLAIECHAACGSFTSKQLGINRHLWLGSPSCMVASHYVWCEYQIPVTGARALATHLQHLMQVLQNEHDSLPPISDSQVEQEAVGVA